MNPRWLLMAALAVPCHAELRVHEPFDADEGPITGLHGGIGWAEAWTQDGDACSVVSGSLVYVDADARSLVTTGAKLDTAGPATTRSFRSLAGAPIEEAWISFLWQLPAANSLYEGVNFFRGATSIFAVSNASTSTSAQLSLNNFPANSSTSAGGGSFGTTHFIVLHLSSTAQGDQIELFLDPPLSGPNRSPNATIVGDDFSFDRLRIAGQSGASLAVDEIRIGDAFSEVAPYLTLDSDGDGLLDAIELELGLDPAVSDADLIAAIQAHPDYFQLLSRDGLRNLAGAGSLLEATDGTAELVFEIQHSDDLSHWASFESVHRSISLPAGKSFLRLSPRVSTTP
ncbi:hypothetical protein HNR46_003128 [Haloferula luteola]|uniref:EF-hand domain-containing protein n=1 Tax=Haloferula luteola TaxID=595692 RepID=A0A840VGD1_9BACT|nr:hypothetical protein [Haloferula luteola]MBB5352879.1 hypothetical protein [Haloferula luteola]